MKLPNKNPSVGTAGISRVVEKSVNSVSAFEAKISVHFLVPEGNPLGGLLLSPANQVAQPSAASLRYGCGIPLAGTTLGFGGAPIGGRSNTVGSPLGGLYCGGTPEVQ